MDDKYGSKSEAGRTMREYKLIYDSPASVWLESLPLGNGRIGAMVFGGVDEERISLNEDTLWSGCAENKMEKQRYPYYLKARELALQGKYAEAQKILDGNFTGEWTESYMPLGDAVIRMLPTGEPEEYRRELCLNTAVHRTMFKTAGAQFVRECFISAPDNVLVMQLKCDGPYLNCDISFESPLRSKTECKDGMLVLKGVCPSHVEPEYVNCREHVFYSEEKEKQGISFCAVLGAETKDGTICCEGDKLCIRNSSRVILRLGVRSNFAGYDVRPIDSDVKYCQNAEADLICASEKDYEQLLADHIEEFSGYFSRTQFELCGQDDFEKSLDRRLKDFQVCKSDNFLIELLFHYGKYLLISASRPGTQAMNLQGIWNHDPVAPWSSNYTLNINTQMNYWLAEPLNLPQMHEPLLQLVEKLAASGKEQAKEYYDACGFVVHHNCDIWQTTIPVGRKEPGKSVHSFWPMAGGWLCRHLFEHFEYTQDVLYLKNRAYPVMKSACEFYSDVLTYDRGEYVFSPATSPENQFLKDGQQVCVARSSAMNIEILGELFHNFLKASKILGVSDAFTAKIEEQLQGLQKIRIGRDGRILEWCEEIGEPGPRHRHLSHLYFAYPNDAALEEQKYVDATVRSLRYRSNEGTGWSLAWKVCLWARLGYADLALEALKNLLRLVTPDKKDIKYSNGGGVYPNLFCAHPPFQIDGNFGAVAGILEMIVSSHNQKVYFLPALPQEWRSGQIRGIKVKGGFTADMKWENGNITYLKIFAENPAAFQYVVGGKEFHVWLDRGENMVICEKVSASA